MVQTKNADFKRVTEGLPINVLLLNPETFTITDANQTSIDTLKQLEEYLPIKADRIVGNNVDIFHKNPAHQRGILSAPQQSALQNPMSLKRMRLC